MEQIKILCPATVANLSCGFDVLGTCLDNVADVMHVKKIAEKKVVIKEIIGANLPLDPQSNVASVAALALMEHLQPDFGIEITIEKNIKPGSGIGSSAASAAGAVYALNALCGYPLEKQDLIAFAMKGEALASGAEHADNVSPALLGNFTLIQSYDPLKVISIPSPEDLFLVVLHPLIELKTKDSRAVIHQQVSLKKATIQCGNLAGFVAGLYTKDYELIKSSLKDEFVEHKRSMLIPFYDLIKEKALENGALGAGISGAGPSIYALCKSQETAQKVAESMQNIAREKQLDFNLHLSPINQQGIKELP
ncbi:homoserine kinase [Myroides sp. LJL115]